MWHHSSLSVNIFYPRNPTAPPYLHRQNFIPYNQSDFGDGGAFPEIHVVQYPLDMGRPGAKSTAVVSVDVDEKGEIRYDAIVKHGGNQKKIVQTSLDDMKEKKGKKFRSCVHCRKITFFR